MFLIKNLNIDKGRTRIFHPLWATGYEGFDIFPPCPAALSNEQGYFKFEQASWIPSEEPVFYQPKQIREYLPHWQGAIAFSSQADFVKIGYYLTGSLLQYLLDFALPSYLQTPPVSLMRWSVVQNSAVSLPPGIDMARANDFFICPPSVSKTMARISEDKLFSLASIPDGPARVVFNYTPLVDRIDSNYFYQITELPCILINPLDGENYRNIGIHNADTVLASNNQILSVVSVFQYDRRLEIIILGEENADIEAIASNIKSKIYLSSSIYLPPFGEDVFFQVNSRMEDDANLEKVKGNVNSRKFDMLVIGLLDQ